MPRDPLEPKVLPKISVVICTFNRHDMLLEAIMSIELQDLPRQEFELIIVDNSDDLQARDRFRDGLQITCAHRYLDEARPGLSRARNIGIHAARAELVRFWMTTPRLPPVGCGISSRRFRRMRRRASWVARYGRSGRRAARTG